MKVKNRLLDYKYIIYQDDDYFKFSLDSVLLANFVTLNLRTKKIIDLACGNAPIPMLLSMRTKALIYGIELQKCIFDLGVESIKENKLNDRIKLINGDVKDISKYFDSDSFDVVVCNPPYFVNSNDKMVNDDIVKAKARHEITLNIDDVLKNARYLLKNGGRLAIVHRTDRFVEILNKFCKYGLQPKKVQFIYPKENRNSDLFLIEGVKNGKVGLKVLPNLIIHNEDNSYKNNIRTMFFEE
ncbi:MAG: tRNA1(Val) (adenine(37)-N6)-methyltransferase [Bacilli bacterium]|nr:tRNA1(Val) (adenine(37)-N6)-methyltransferase [Bacilli bacterium]